MVRDNLGNDMMELRDCLPKHHTHVFARILPINDVRLEGLGRSTKALEYLIKGRWHLLGMQAPHC